MSLSREDEVTTNVTRPLAKQSPLFRHLKGFLLTAECPQDWKYQLCFTNQNKQTGRAVLDDVPLGAVFSVQDPQNPHAYLPVQKRIYEESILANRGEFWADDRTRNLNYYQPEGPFDYRVPPAWVRGVTDYYDADRLYRGVFWKAGAGATTPTSMAWPPKPCCPVVDLLKPLQRGLSTDAQNSFTNFPSGWPVSRHLKG